MSCRACTGLDYFCFILMAFLITGNSGSFSTGSLRNQYLPYQRNSYENQDLSTPVSTAHPYQQHSSENHLYNSLSQLQPHELYNHQYQPPYSYQQGDQYNHVDNGQFVHNGFQSPDHTGFSPIGGIHIQPGLPKPQHHDGFMLPNGASSTSTPYDSHSGYTYPQPQYGHQEPQWMLMNIPYQFAEEEGHHHEIPLKEGKSHQKGSGYHLKENMDQLITAGERQPDMIAEKAETSYWSKFSATEPKQSARRGLGMPLLCDLLCPCHKILCGIFCTKNGRHQGTSSALHSLDAYGKEAAVNMPCNCLRNHL